jgi:hypothetical protein
MLYLRRWLRILHKNTAWQIWELSEHSLAWTRWMKFVVSVPLSRHHRAVDKTTNMHSSCFCLDSF